MSTARIYGFYSVAFVQRMLNTSLLYSFNSNGKNRDGSKSDKNLFNRNTAYESVLENPSVAQSSL
jgi:hypothetical protein